MKKLALTILALGLSLPLASNPGTTQAQNAILADLYGRGVHAHYAGKSQEAYDHFSMAINNGIEDPRAYYFRGITACALGRQYEAESDWQRGAELEARGKIVGSIGRSLTRFQGPDRIKLEEVRQKAKLDFLAQAAMRSKARYGEIQSTQGDMLRSRPLGAAPRSSITPPPVPPAADDNPFSDDLGEPKVDSDDALEGAMTAPPAEDAAPAVVDDTPAAPAADADGTDAADPFGSDSDPFGGSSDPFGGDSDPFSN
ncbi:hypothetical protein LF1_33780 [Rubripirellula obstinata]|uniref:Tetratricopeptide repeat protein n=1 Tax=Rubripirellula obstinata TaxID=406547 RepID=A0A5B1CJU1_9BACT|nr:hypothetical protein [Rubripirellula obstinata]KAA1260836.1 hypothetical protein LF1_33780 [Rubripirellula obstinata]